jgi:hypothetical protein
MRGEVDLELRLLDKCRAGSSLSLSLRRLQNMFGRLRESSCVSSSHVLILPCLSEDINPPTMRLLQRNKAGRYTLTEFTDNAIPHYAILSHTWGADHDEVTLADLEKDTDIAKAGYKKLQFCADQAAEDHLCYF